YRRAFRHRGPRQRLCADAVHACVRARARVRGAKERQLPHRASLLPERAVLSAAATPSCPDVEVGVQGFRSSDAQLSWGAPRMRSQFAFDSRRAPEPRPGMIELTQKRRRTLEGPPPLNGDLGILSDRS